jgi:hypothetical protein
VLGVVGDLPAQASDAPLAGEAAGAADLAVAVVQLKRM